MAREEGGAQHWKVREGGSQRPRSHNNSLQFPEGRKKPLKDFMYNKYGLHFENLFLPSFLTRWRESWNRSRETSLQDDSAVYSSGKREWGQIHADSESDLRRAVRLLDGHS